MADSHDNDHLRIVTGGTDLTPKPPPVRTKEEALNYLNERVELLKRKRAQYDVEIPGRADLTALSQEKAFRQMLIHVGVVMGTAASLFVSGLIDEVAYNHFHNQALVSMAAKVMGSVTGEG